LSVTSKVFVSRTCWTAGNTFLSPFSYSHICAQTSIHFWYHILGYAFVLLIVEIISLAISTYGSTMLVQSLEGEKLSCAKLTLRLLQLSYLD
jgi:hypothetical protein